MQDLETQFKISRKDVEQKKNGSELYDFLDEIRQNCFKRKSEEREYMINKALIAHQTSLAFRNQIKDYVTGGNRTEQVATSIVRSLVGQNVGIAPVCLSDATGSMEDLWAKAKLETQ